MLFSHVIWGKHRQLALPPIIMRNRRALLDDFAHNIRIFLGNLLLKIEKNKVVCDEYK